MTNLRKAAQRALEALELAQTDVHWELNSPTRKVLRKAEKCLRAALAEQPLTIKRLRDALVASRVIPPEAVEDADNYDDGVMLHRIEALFRRIA